MKPRADEDAFRVRFEGAFPSYFDADTERRVRGLITNSGRSRGYYGEGGNRYTFSVLREARCAFERAPGQRCGRVLRPCESADEMPGHSSYRALDCGRWLRPPHITHAPAILGEHVLDVLCEVFSPARLRAVADGVVVDQGELSAQRAGIEELIRQEEGREEAASGLALEAEKRRRAAEKAGDNDEAATQARLKARWEAATTEAARASGRHRKRLLAFEAQEDEFLSVQGGTLDRVVQLATDLRALIERARSVPHALQRIVEALTERVWVRRLGLGVYEFSVEFASGAEIRRIFTHDGPPRGSQPQRLLARHRIAAGVCPTDVAMELAQAAEVRINGWSQDAVLGVAAYNEHFEHIFSRDGDHRKVKQIAADVGEPEMIVQKVALAGMLGPALWEEGELTYRPTEAELHRALPAHAAREVARMYGLGDGELVSFVDLSRANRDATGKTSSQVRRCAAYRDAANNGWCRVEDVEALGLSTDANRVLRAEARKALVEAVGALPGEALDPDEFVCAADFARQMKSRFPSITYGRVRCAYTRGHIVGVRALGLRSDGKSSPNLLFVRVPVEVRQAEKGDVVWDWLRGNWKSRD